MVDELAGPPGSCDMTAQFLCGNGVVDAGEVCDQSSLRGASCLSATALARPNGMLGCAADCKAYDTSACIRCALLFGTVVEGQCWVLGSPAASCEAACAANSMTVSAATLDMKPSTAARCGWVLSKLGASAESVEPSVSPQ